MSKLKKYAKSLKSVCQTSILDKFVLRSETMHLYEFAMSNDQQYAIAEQMGRLGLAEFLPT